MAQEKMTWASAFIEAGCYGFLDSIAVQTVNAVLALCPEGESLVAHNARQELHRLCIQRLMPIYERPLIQLAKKRVGLLESFSLCAGEEVRSRVMLNIAGAVRDEVCADKGASLCECLPLLSGYERAVASNFSMAVSELLVRLLARRDEISRNLLDGRVITRVLGFSASGADSHCHGRMVMCIGTNAGTFYYKPRDCWLDDFFKIVDAWYSDCTRTAQLVLGDGYAFVERLVPHELSSGEELHAYWRNLGRLTALFHGLGSRDMTQDNIMSCGVLPAVLDLEVLIAGQMALDEQPPPIGIVMEGVSASDLSESVICTSILPMRMGNMVVSPLVEDNVSGTCLPRLDGAERSEAAGPQGRECAVTVHSEGGGLGDALLLVCELQGIAYA